MRKEIERRLAVVLVVFFVAGWVFGFITNEVTRDFFADNKVVVTETYTVKRGDTFWKIAEQYHGLDCRNLYIFEYMDELRELNPHLKENHNQVNVGDELTITYFRKEQ